MKRLFLKTIFWLVSAGIGALGQNSGADSLRERGREKILKLKEEFMLQNLQLTDKETEAFLKAMREFEQKRMVLRQQLRQVRRQMQRNRSMLTAEELSRLLDQTMNLERQLHEERERYIKSLRQMFPPQKVLDILHLERTFMESLWQRIRDNGPRDMVAPAPQHRFGPPRPRYPH